MNQLYNPRKLNKIHALQEVTEVSGFEKTFGTSVVL